MFGTNCVCPQMYLRSLKSDAHVVHFIAGQKGFPTGVCVWPKMCYSYVRPSQSDVSQAKRVRKHMMFHMFPNISFVQRKHVYRDSSCLRDMCLWLGGVHVTLFTCLWGCAGARLGSFMPLATPVPTHPCADTQWQPIWP